MRNKSLLFIFIASFFCTPTFCQSYLGLAGGGMPGKVQVQGALYFEVPFNEKLDLQVGALYLRVNTPALLDLLPSDKNYYDLIISYPGVSLSLKHTILNNRLRVYGLGGIYSRYATHIQASFQKRFRFESEKRSFSEIEVERFDFGLSLGLGIEHTLRKHRKIFVSLAYQYSLTPVYIGVSRYNNQFMLFNAGFLYPLF